MADALLRLVIRTPHGLVLDEPVRAVRLSTETGMVGLRPKGEPMVLAVEPGLVVVRLASGASRFVATAGGLLRCDRERGTLYTPYAAVGDSEATMLAALDEMTAAPGRDLLARRQLGELEQRIVHELGARPHEPGARPHEPGARPHEPGARPHELSVPPHPPRPSRGRHG